MLSKHFEMAFISTNGVSCALVEGIVQAVLRRDKLLSCLEVCYLGLGPRETLDCTFIFLENLH